MFSEAQTCWGYNMGSSKGGGTEAPPPQVQQGSEDNTAAMMALMQMSMMQNAQNQQQQQQRPNTPNVPQARQAPTIDWTEKQDQLAAKAKADYASDSSKRKGRENTILTGSLLDEEEVETTTSVLSGS